MLHLKITLASGRVLPLPVEWVDEDRVVGSDGTHPLDRIRIASEAGCGDEWCERRDLCNDDCEPVAWEPYPLDDGFDAGCGRPAVCR